MIARLRPWWQKLSKHLIVVAITVVVVGVLALVIFGYLLRLAWTGFFNRTLWDWLQLLIVPLVLAIIALVFQLANSRTERQIAKQRYEQDQQIALDKQHEDLLQAYLDRMAELLLEKQLGTSASEEVRNVARVRTITVLTQLNGRRIGYVFTFLREAGLMSTIPNSSVVSLKDADLRAVKWSQANPREADLREANLREANLSGLDFRGLDLSGADLSKANLSEANLSEANLREANLSEVDLRRANLSGTTLCAVIVSFPGFNVDLCGGNEAQELMSGADLFKANLSKVKLTDCVAKIFKLIKTKHILQSL